VINDVHLCLFLVAFALCFICQNLVFRRKKIHVLALFFMLQLLVPLFLCCYSCVVFLVFIFMLYLSHYLFLRCCSLNVSTPLALLLFKCWCSFHVATLPTLLFLHRSSHGPILKPLLLRCTSHTSPPMLHLSHYPSHATPFVLHLSCSLIVLLFSHYNSCVVFFTLQFFPATTIFIFFLSSC
jgi:hypothetical protein